MAVKDLVTNPDGRLSTSDAFLFFGAGIVFTLWLAAGVLIYHGYIMWDTYSGWFSWGRDFVIAAVAAYVGKRMTYKAEADPGIEDRGPE